MACSSNTISVICALVIWAPDHWHSPYILDHITASFSFRAFVCAILCLEDSHLQLLLGISLNFTSLTRPSLVFPHKKLPSSILPHHNSLLLVSFIEFIMIFNLFTYALSP